MNTNLRSKDFRRMGLDALRGNWPTAVLTGFVASLLGAGVTSSGSPINSISYGFSATDLETILDSEYGEIFLSIILVVLAFTALYSIALLLISGAARLGYASYNLQLVDRANPQFSTLFSQMKRIWSGFCLNFFTVLYTLLWSLLLIVPGIIKSFSYAMAPYILAENPDMTANMALTKSREIMQGHKWELFKLLLSFIGWILLPFVPFFVTLVLAVITEWVVLIIFGILLFIPLVIAAGLFLTPYIEAAQAAFYRSIAPAKSEAEPVIEDKQPII